jgi:tRNA-specific 2-thiouridylase
MARPTVLLGMSGGVDSSVTAALLVRQGYDVHGVTLQVWEHEDESVAASKRWQERGCCKIGVARYVAQKLNIPYEVVDQRHHFQSQVIDDFIAGYVGGTTPNPCVRCNERVKLRGLIELATQRGFDYVATGHYANIERHGQGYALRKAADFGKDQSYFLYRADAAWLPRLLFPLGSFYKKDVWKEAEAIGLPVDELRESQEICFVSTGDYRSFLEREAPQAKRPGHFVDMDSNQLGSHEGIAFYTPGQRRGLGVAAGRRLYVQRVVPETNTVVLGPEEHLLRTECVVQDLNVFDPALRETSLDVDVKIRYATPASPASLAPQRDGGVRVLFQVPQRAVSPGQSAVFYAGDRVVGGGIIQPF